MEEEPAAQNRARWFRQAAVRAEDAQPSFRGSLILTEKDNIRPLSDRSYQSYKNARVGGSALAAPPPEQQAPLVNPTPTAPPASGAQKSAASTAETSALQEHNRVRLLDESDPGPPPRQRIAGTSSKNKTRDQFEREKEAYEKAKATAAVNHKANGENKQTLKAWENYDRAIQLMEKAPEGRKILDHLRNDKTRVFKVVIVNDPVKDSFMGVSIKDGAQGEYVNIGKKDEMGRDIHVLFLTKSALEGDTLKPDGTINPDAEAIDKIWHEIYHAYERHMSSTGGVDPLGIGTSSRNDRLTHQQQSHERRAVRFENIIRKRNGGTRMKDIYGGGYKIINGVRHDIPPIPVPDALPPLVPIELK